MKVLFFGQLRDTLNTSQLQIESSPKDVVSLIKELSDRGEVWQRALSSDAVLVAVNQTLSDKQCLLNEHDEVALFPPVTGG